MKSAIGSLAISEVFIAAQIRGRRVEMRLLFGTLAIAASSTAIAGPGTLGTPLGIALGSTLGSALPILGSGLLVVAASSLIIGIRIARKKKRKS